MAVLFRDFFRLFAAFRGSIFVFIAMQARNAFWEHEFAIRWDFGAGVECDVKFTRNFWQELNHLSVLYNRCKVWVCLRVCL